MKALSILGLSLGILIYFLIALQWTSGARVYEALYTFLAGFAHGMLHSAMFGALAACCSKSMVASSITSFHLCQQVGSILGTGISTAALQGIFRASLSRDLPNNPQKYHVCDYLCRAYSESSILKNKILTSFPDYPRCFKRYQFFQNVTS